MFNLEQSKVRIKYQDRKSEHRYIMVHQILSNENTISFIRSDMILVSSEAC